MSVFPFHMLSKRARIPQENYEMIIGSAGFAAGEYLSETLPAEVSFANGIIYGRMFTLGSQAPPDGDKVLVSGYDSGDVERFKIYINRSAGGDITFQATDDGTNTFISAVLPSITSLTWAHIQFYINFAVPADSKVFLGNTENTFATVPTASVQTADIASYRLLNGWGAGSKIAEYMVDFSSSLTSTTFLRGRIALAERDDITPTPRPYSLGDKGDFPFGILPFLSPLSGL